MKQISWILAWVSYITSIFCLVGAYLPIDIWKILIGIPLLALLLLAIKKLKGNWPIYSIFVIYIFLIVLGLSEGRSLPLVMIGIVCAFTWWDLELFNRNVILDTASEHVEIIQANHLKSLILVIIISVGLMAISSQIHIQLTFWWIFGLSIVAVFGLFFFFYQMKKN